LTTNAKKIFRRAAYREESPPVKALKIAAEILCAPLILHAGQNFQNFRKNFRKFLKKPEKAKTTKINFNINFNLSAWGERS
jgi:hypothetical protein